MPVCDWCPKEQPQEAVAQLPLADKEIKGGKKIFVCRAHKQWADDHHWYVETLEGQPIGADALIRRINEKHQRIRGSLELKFKPKPATKSDKPIRRIPGAQH